MSFAYKPMTEQDAMKARYQLLDDGEYDAVVFDILPRMSSSNNWMWEIYLNVYDKNGNVTKIRDYLVFSEKMMWKVIHCADSAGLSQEYMDGKFMPELLKNASIRVAIKTQAGSEIPVEKLQGKAPGSKYPDKNVVNDYVKRIVTPKAANDATAPAKPAFDDDIPF